MIRGRRGVKGVGRGLGTGFDVGVSRCWLGNRSFFFFFFYGTGLFGMVFGMLCCIIP